MAEFQQNVYLLIATCEKTNFDYAIPLQNSKTQTIAASSMLARPIIQSVDRTGYSSHIPRHSSFFHNSLIRWIEPKRIYEKIGDMTRD